MNARRFLRGALLLALALLLIQASSYGLVGRLVAFTSHRVLGSAGVAALTIVLIVAGFWLVVPSSVWRALRFPAVRAPRMPRIRTRVSHEVAVYGLLYTPPPPRAAIPARVIDVPSRGKLSDVESALKHLGFAKHEYSFVANMDASKDLETLMREALKKLRKT